MRARSRKVVFDGHTFDSQSERDRYIVLRDMQRKGEISQLQIHPQFNFFWPGNNVKIGRGYRPDFSYVRHVPDVYDVDDNRVVVKGTSEHIVEDVKGWKKSPKTGKLLPRVDKGFRLRCDLMLACYGLKVVLV
jgi:hypothetical protein